jgi:TP901 family phage tail tape measure protein
MVADTSQFEKKMLTANQIMGGIGKAGFFMGIGVAAGIGAAVHEAGNFQESMNVLQAVTGATSKQVGAMRKEALALGADLKLPNTSAQDAADTLTELAKGGLSVKQAMQAARGSIQLATAAQISNTDAAKVEVNVLSAFGLRATNASKVADMLANAANASTGDIGDMALAVQQAGGTFHAAGQSFSSLATATALLANNGVKGEVAGTGLKMSLLRLANPTKIATAELDKLNIKTQDAHHNFLPLRTIVGELHDRTKNMGSATRAAAEDMIFGASGTKVMAGVIQKGLPAWDAMHKKIERQGTAQRIATAHTKGFNGAVQGFISSIQTAAINIGTLFLPMMTTMVRWLSRGAEMMSRHATTTKTLLIALGLLATAMVTLTGIYKIYMGVTKLVEFYQNLFSKSVFVTRIQLMALAVWQRVVTVAQWAMNAAMDANPIMLVVIGLIALAAILIIAYKRSGTFREIVNATWDDLKKFAGWVKDVFTKYISKAFEWVVNWLKAHWKDAVILLVGGPFLLLLKKADDAFGLRQKLAAGLQTVLGKIRDWGSAVVNFFQNLPGRIAGFATRLGNTLKNGVISAVRGMASTLAGIVRGAINTVIAAWNGLSIPGFSWGVHKGPIDFSVSIPNIPLPDIPRLAKGAVVTSPTLALLGDNLGKSEAIVPLPERRDLLTGGGGDGITINLTVEGSILSDRQLEQKLMDVLTTYGKRNGRVRLATASTI